MLNNITFIEDPEHGYKHRTYENVRLADITIAFAIDPESSGEIMTRDATIEYNKPFIMVDLFNNTVKMERIPENVADIHTINVAGNGMSRFRKYNYTQEVVDETVYVYLQRFIEDYKLTIESIRSGGQTGADESGIKAAYKLNIPAICLCPKGWRFRTGICDISDETLFKERFILKKETILLF